MGMPHIRLATSIADVKARHRGVHVIQYRASSRQDRDAAMSDVIEDVWRTQQSASSDPSTYVIDLSHLSEVPDRMWGLLEGMRSGVLYRPGGARMEICPSPHIYVCIDKRRVPAYMESSFNTLE